MSQPSLDAILHLPHGGQKIEARGRVHLGRRMLLEERPVDVAPRAPFRFSPAAPDDDALAPIESSAADAPPGQLPMRRLEQSLRSTDEDLYLRDKGLTLSYGIFGAPRSGKTYLMLYMLEQLLAIEREDTERKFGALILDPKAALVGDVYDACVAARRAEDLVVLGDVAATEINVIDCDLDAYELSRALVLAAQSAGVAASEPYWFGAWQNMFAAAIHLMRWLGDGVLTLRDLVRAALVDDQADCDIGNLSGGDVLDTEPRRVLQRYADAARARIHELAPEMRDEALLAADQIDRFYAQKPEDRAVVENIIQQSYGAFLRGDTLRYSKRLVDAPGRTTFYDTIIEDGCVVLVSISPSQPGLAKVICTLVKNLFMQSVRSRLDRCIAHRLTNFKRPLLIACDEYSQVASEIPGQAGDGDFFSLAAQQGCMGIMATQSVNVLEATSLKESWKSVFSNFSAKIFMRAVDNETVEQATKLAGESDWYVTSLGTSSGSGGMGASQSRDLRERKALPSTVLTQLLEQGQAVIVGSLDGRTRPATYFLAVERKP